MKKCMNCGADIQGDALFCYFCGCRLDQAQSPAEPDPTPTEPAIEPKKPEKAPKPEKPKKEEAPKPEKASASPHGKKILAVVLILLAVAVIAAAVILLTGNMNKAAGQKADFASRTKAPQFENAPVLTPAPAALPDCAGMTADEAMALLGEYGVQAVIANEYSDFEPGTVLAQSDPVNGIVTLTVSMGPEAPAPLPVVPALVGRNLEEATAAAEAVGLGVVVLGELPSDTVAAGLICDQFPAPDTLLTAGDTVSVTISTGPVPLTVEDVAGMKEAEAREALEGLGLQVVTAEEYSKEVRKGRVIRMKPAADVPLYAGDTVTLVISRGEEEARTKTVKMPNVVGKAQSRAEDTLKDLGLKVKIKRAYSSTTKGIVIKQSVSEGKTVEEGTTVTLTVSAGAKDSGSSDELKYAYVPGVVGQTKADASTAITSRGFQVSVRYESSSSIAEGLVTAQSPSSGEMLEKGETVTITVSTGN